MSLERLGLPSRERAVRVASATLIFSLPVAAGYLAKREMSSRKRIRNEQENQSEKLRKEAISASEDSNNSGDSGFIFQRE